MVLSDKKGTGKLSSKSNFIRKGALVLFVKVLSTLLAFVLSVVLARNLGAEDFGTYSFVISVLMLISIPIVAGFPNLAVRETAKALVHQNWELVRELRRWVFIRIFIYVLILLGIVVLYIVFSNSIEVSNRYAAFMLGMLSVPAYALLMSSGAFVRGTGHPILGILPDSIIKQSMGLLLVWVYVYYESGGVFAAEDAIVVYLVSVCTAATISLLILNRLLKNQRTQPVTVEQSFDQWWSALKPLTIAGGVQLLFGYIDVVILGIFRDDEEVGVYRVMMLLSGLVAFGLTVLNQYLHPHISSLFNSGDIDKLQKIILTSARVIVLMALIPALMFLFGGGVIVERIYGDEYLTGVLALKILVLGQLINAGFGSVGALLSMTGHEKDALLGLSLALVVNLVLNLTLVPDFGIEGAAFSTFVALLVWNSVLRYYVRTRLRIESSGLVFLKGKS